MRVIARSKAAIVGRELWTSTGSISRLAPKRDRLVVTTGRATKLLAARDVAPIESGSEDAQRTVRRRHIEHRCQPGVVVVNDHATARRSRAT